MTSNFTIEEDIRFNHNQSQIEANYEQSEWSEYPLNDNSHYPSRNDQFLDRDSLNHSQIVPSYGQGLFISTASTQFDSLTTQDHQFTNSGFSLDEKEEQPFTLSSSRNLGYLKEKDLNSVFKKDEEQFQGEYSMQNNPSSIFSTNGLDETSFPMEQFIKSKDNGSCNQQPKVDEIGEPPKMTSEQQNQSQSQPSFSAQTRKRRQPLTQEKAKIKKQQESKNMINSIIHYVQKVKDAQKNLKLKKNCSLREFVQKLVKLQKDDQQITKSLIKNYFFEEYLVHTFPNSNYIEDPDSYPEYIEAFFNLLDFYTSPKFKQNTEIKSVPFKQFLNLP